VGTPTDVPSEAGGVRRGSPRPETVARYREALALYASGDMTAARICKQCGVPESGFRSYLHKYHRDLLLARHGISAPTIPDAAHMRLRGRRGQSPATRAKYRDAIVACDDEAYLEYNVSQVARLFKLDPTGLANQLRAHYPDILERREAERRRRGLADNQQRGVRPWCREQYAGAVELLRTTELTLLEVAERCGVSLSGLHQHILYYHKDLVEQRSDLRECGKSSKRKGHVTGNGRRHEPKPETRERYREAARLYRDTALTVKEIAGKLGLNIYSLRSYLQTWHREELFARRGAEYREGASLSGTKQYKKPAAAKYAAAIARLREEPDRPTTEVASEFGLHPEVFRQYLKEHEPELYARQGMMRAPNGRLVSRRSMERYGEALRLYESTDESLKSIAGRLGLTYNSLGGFLRRNFPELIERHDALQGGSRSEDCPAEAIPLTDNGPERISKPRPETEEQYREAVGLYRSTELSCSEISRRCGVSLSGLKGHICKYHRHLMLARYDISCSHAEAGNIRLGQLRGQLPATRAKYRDAIEACDSMDYIEYNVSQIARRFGLDGTNLGKQLRTHYPGVIERREEVRKRLGLSDNLPRGARPFCGEQYAGAVKLLRADRYITVREAAEHCDVSMAGLEQHLLFYHKELVNKRIEIRGKAVRQQLKGKITGRGTAHAPKPATVEKYAEALRLYRTTPLSAMQIAARTNVPRKGFYSYLQTWHKELICRRKGIPYQEGVPVDWSTTRKYNPATKVKYAEAIERLKQSGLPTAKVAAEFGLQAECFRQYLKEHEPELYARQGMMRAPNGRLVSRRSMEKYAEAIRLYETTPESLRYIAQRLGFRYTDLKLFVHRSRPEAIARHEALVAARDKARLGR